MQQLMSNVCPLFYVQTRYIGITRRRASDCSFDGRHLSLEMTCDPVRINLLGVHICSPHCLSLPTLITRQQFSDQWRVKAKWTQVDSVDSVCVFVCLLINQSCVFVYWPAITDTASRFVQHRIIITQMHHCIVLHLQCCVQEFFKENSKLSQYFLTVCKVSLIYNAVNIRISPS